MKRICANWLLCRVNYHTCPHSQLHDPIEGCDGKFFSFPCSSRGAPTGLWDCKNFPGNTKKSCPRILNQGMCLEAGDEAKDMP